jgi:hypothetical protein
MSPYFVKILPARLRTLGEEYLISTFLPPTVFDSVAAGLCAHARLAAPSIAPHSKSNLMFYSSFGIAPKPFYQQCLTEAVPQATGPLPHALEYATLNRGWESEMEISGGPNEENQETVA